MDWITYILTLLFFLGLTAIKKIVDECAEMCSSNASKDPVDILRLFQKKIVCGRDLELKDDSTTIEGETNFILVDRNDILETAFEDIDSITNLRLTLEVQFLGEVIVKWKIIIMKW